jgi:vitamin B12 transporter
MLCIQLRVSRGLCVLLSAFSFAANASASDDQLETVYSDFLSASDTAPEFSVTNATVITTESFPTSALTAADVIEQAPSVQVQNQGEQGSFSNVSVRGAPSQQTQIYIDGILQSNVGGNGGYLQQIPLTNVDRIEVYSGSLPGQFSQATPGGAINIIRKKENRTQLSLIADSGSLGRRRFSTVAEQQYGHWHFSGFAEALGTDNDFEYINDNGTSLNSEDDSIQRRNNAEYQSLQASAKATWQKKDTQFHLAAEGFDNTKNLPHWNNLEAVNTYYRQHGISLTSGVGWNQWISGLDSDLRWHSAQHNGHFSDPDSLIGLHINDSYDELTSHQLQHHSVLSIPTGLMTLTNEWQYGHFRIKDDKIGVTLNAQRNQFSNSLSNDWFINDRLTLAATGRHLWYEDQHDSVTENHQQWGAEFGARFDINNITLKWNVQHATRQPSLIERFGNQGSFVGNADLKSEQATATDLSLLYLADNIQWQSSLFYRHAENAIAPTYSSQGIGRYINLNTAKFAGIEWNGIYRFPSIQLLSSGSLQDSIALNNQKAFDQKQVPGYYPVSTTQTLAWKIRPALNLSVSYLFETGLYYDRTNSTQAPDKHQINTLMNWKVGAFDLSFEIKNLLNRAHLDFSRMPLPGRTYIATLKYSMGEKK